MKILLLSLLFLLSGCEDDPTMMEVCPSGNTFIYPQGYDSVAACAGPTTQINWPGIPLKVRIDPSVSSTYGESIDEAISFWNKEVTTLFVKVSSPPYDVLITDGVARDGELGATYHTIVDGRLTATVELRRPGDITTAFYITAHELGHVMGLAHDRAPASVMYGFLEYSVESDKGPFRTMLVDGPDCAAILKKY